MKAISSLRILAIVALFVAGILSFFAAASTTDTWLFLLCAGVGFLSFPLAGRIYRRWLHDDPWLRAYHRWTSRSL